jgi:hypothetical protein
MTVSNFICLRNTLADTHVYSTYILSTFNPFFWCIFNENVA